MAKRVKRRRKKRSERLAEEAAAKSEVKLPAKRRRSRRAKRRTIDMPTLDKMVSDGKTNIEIAEFFNVHHTVISRMRNNDLVEWRNQQIAETPSSIQDRMVSTIDQIANCNQTINNVHEMISEHFAEKDKIDHSDIALINSMIRVQQEMRAQMTFNKDFMQDFYNMAGIVAWQERMMDTWKEIEAEHPELSDKIAGLIGSAENTE